MKIINLALIIVFSFRPLFAQDAEPTSGELGFRPESTPLSGRYSAVVRSAGGVLVRVHVLHFFKGERVFVLVGQSNVDGGLDSARLSRSADALLALSQFKSGKTADEIGGLLPANRTSRSSAVLALEASWAERVFCYPGRGTPKALARFNHNRSPAERFAMISDARYVEDLDLWIFGGYCAGPALLG